MQMIKDMIRRLRVVWMRWHRCGALETSSLRRALIVAPHPDDEVIGCGGLIARLVREGHAPQVVILTDGERSVEMDDDEVMAHRHELTLKAAATLGLPEENIHCLHFPDGGIPDSSSNSVLAALLSQADSVFVPHTGEGWPDHLNAGRMVRHALGNMLKQNSVPPPISIYEYCVWVWYYNVWRLDWTNARLLRLSTDEHRIKLRAIDTYTLPLAPCGKPWSGVLPKVFLWAVRWNKELYFKAAFI